MTTATDLTARRAEVARLRAGGLSIRQIAVRLGASPAAIERDIKALKRTTETATDTAPEQGESPAAPPRILDVALSPQRPAETPPRDTDTPFRDTAPRHRYTNRDTETPSLVVPLDPALLADLATLTRNGVAPAAAIRHAVGYMARTYRQAWDAGLYPADVNPALERHQFAPYKPPHPTGPSSPHGI